MADQTYIVRYHKPRKAFGTMLTSGLYPKNVTIWNPEGILIEGNTYTVRKMEAFDGGAKLVYLDQVYPERAFPGYYFVDALKTTKQSTKLKNNKRP